MADAMTVRIEGLDVLDRRLKELGAKTAAKVLRAALKAAAKPVVEEAKARVDVDTGALQKGIRAKVSVTSSRGASASVGYDKKTFWGKFKEMGTSRMPARPFLRPALDSKASEAVGIFAARLKKRIDAVTAVV